MIFESLNFPFGYIHTMVVQSDKLHLYVLTLEIRFYGICCHIVNNIENGLDTTLGNVCDVFFERRHNCFSC